MPDILAEYRPLGPITRSVAESYGLGSEAIRSVENQGPIFYELALNTIPGFVLPELLRSLPDGRGSVYTLRIKSPLDGWWAC